MMHGPVHIKFKCFVYSKNKMPFSQNLLMLQATLTTYYLTLLN